VGGRFVGRVGELSALRAVIEHPERGRGPSAVALVGEPGAGKTRLLGEALEEVDGPRLLRVVGFEPEQQVPLAAAADLLRSLTKAPEKGARLEALLRGDDPGPDLIEPIRVFEAANEALSELGPTLVVFDDVQWADDMSIALCLHLLRAARAENRPLSLVCASRPGHKASSFTHSLGGLLPDPTDYVEITLGPLDLEAGVKLARYIDPDLKSEDAEELCRAAGGSPFWIDALARGGSQPGQPLAAISIQLRAVRGDGAECLAAIVVAARPMRHPEISDVLEWERARVDHVAAELVNRGLVVPIDSSLQIAHDLIREEARRQIPERELRRLHRRLAERIERDAGDDLQPLMEALEHQRAAGSESVSLALKIARSPKRRLLDTDGLGQLAAIADGAPSTDPGILALLAQLATIAGELGQHAFALERWTALSYRQVTASERAHAAIQGARHALDLKRSSEASGLLDRARAEASDDPWTQVEADALDHARRAWVDHDTAGAKGSMQRAVQTARSLLARVGSVDSLEEGARRAYVEALQAEHNAAMIADDVAQMVLSADEMLGATRGLGEDHLRAQANAALSLELLNHWREAEMRLDRVLKEARAQVFPGLTAEITYELAYTKYNLGELDEAGSLLEGASRLEERLARPARRKIAMSLVRSLGYLIEASRGSWQNAIESLRDEATREPDPHCRLDLRQWAAVCAARFGGSDWRDLVITELDSAEADAIAADCGRCHGELRLVSAECFARVQSEERAAELIARWDATHTSPQPRAALLRMRAQGVLAAVDDRVSAVAPLHEVVDRARAAEMRLDELWGLIDLGAALAPDDRDRAIDTWSAALDLAGDLGARSQEALVQRHLRGLGVRAWPRGHAKGGDSPLGSLSDRELEVARLAASGSRNAEIAESLFLSPKTVERHLSNVFAKLDVRNRAELGSRFASELVDGGSPSAD